jgi:adenine-specific DNA methylase
LHIWRARRPLAACRAVLCAALWPDPADPDCPAAFRTAAADAITDFGKLVTSNPKLFVSADATNRPRWTALGKGEQTLNPANAADLVTLRGLLLDFIAEFANWDNSTVPAFLDTARRLTQAAHEALGGEPGTRPLVADPFAGGGSIPLEALRVGADAFASDLNPVAVLLNKMVLEYIPRHGRELADEVRKWGKWVKEKAEAELKAFYPKDADGSTPIAYLWARTITCEGPGCGATVPLVRSLWLAKKGDHSVALRLMPKPDAKRVDVEIIQKAKAKDVGSGTVKRGSATCACCGYTTPVASVRDQLKKRRGGVKEARLLCVVTTKESSQGRFYRLPTERDLTAACKASERLEVRNREHSGPLSFVPDEVIDRTEIRRISVPMYGMERWGDLFSPRQALTLGTLACELSELPVKAEAEVGLATAVLTCLAFAIDRCADKFATQVIWHSGGEFFDHVFARQAIPITWEFAEANIFSDIGWNVAVEWVASSTTFSALPSSIASPIVRLTERRAVGLVATSANCSGLSAGRPSASSASIGRPSAVPSGSPRSCAASAGSSARRYCSSGAGPRITTDNTACNSALLAGTAGRPAAAYASTKSATTRPSTSASMISTMTEPLDR